MTAKPSRPDEFDRAYRDRIVDAVWKAVVDASRDPATGLSPVRNYEVYDALLHVQAMILASANDSGSPAKMRAIGTDFAKRLRRLVAEFKNTYDRDGAPFAVVDTDKMQ